MGKRSGWRGRELSTKCGMWHKFTLNHSFGKTSQQQQHCGKVRYTREVNGEEGRVEVVGSSSREAPSK